jgi:methyl-accepting chemotaxis protein
MMLTSALVVVMLIMGSGLCSLHCRQRLNHYRQMAQGIHYINHIEKILEHLPQHRGMANTFLNGDKSFLEKMTGMQQTLEQDINTIDQYHAQHNVHADILSRWQTIKSGWGSLKQNVQSLSAGESFERHSALIGEVLYLISDAADRMSLSNHPEPSARQIIQTTFNLLPPIIENIGQARGIGSGAAAHGTLLTAVRIKLEFLHQRLSTTAHNAYSTIERSIQQNVSFQISRDNIANSQRQTEDFLGTMSHQLLGEKITISASDYFSEGSSAFNSNLALLGGITTALIQQINNTLPELKTRYLWSITLTVGSAIVLTLMWWNIAS